MRRWAKEMGIRCVDSTALQMSRVEERIPQRGGIPSSSHLFRMSWGRLVIGVIAEATPAGMKTLGSRKPILCALVEDRPLAREWEPGSEEGRYLCRRHY